MNKDNDAVRERPALKNAPPRPWSLRALSSRTVPALCALLFIAFAVRMFHASTTFMWGDEGFSVFSASRDLYAITFEGKDVDPHPPLYYYLFHFWLPLAGTSKLAIRFFSIFFGTATVAVIFALGKKAYGPRIGLIAAALLALAPFGVQYSQEVRMYALVMFLGACTVYILLQLLDRETRGRWILFFVSMFLTQYSLYQAAFLFVAQGIFLLPFVKTRFPFILKWLAASLLIVILFLPWLALHSSTAFIDIKDVAGDSRPMGLSEFLASGFAAIAVGPRVPLGSALVLSALFLAILLIGLVLMLALRTATRSDWLLTIHIAIPMLLYYPIYYLAPLYRGRLFALALVPLVLLLARSAALLTARVKLAAVPLAIVVLGTYVYSLGNYFYNYSRYDARVDDYLPAIRAIEERAVAGDVVLFHAYWQIGYFLTEYHGPPIEYRFLDNARDVAVATDKPRNVWAIVQGLPIHGGEVTLDRAAYPYDETDYGQMRVLAFRAGNPSRVENFSPPIQFENGITLLGYRANATPVEAGHDAATIELQWRAAQKIADDFTMSVRLIGAQGQVISQIDSQPLNGLAPTSSWNAGDTIVDRRGLPIPASAPAGDYAIQMVIYQYVDNQVSRVVAPENLRGPLVSLGTISVIALKK